MMRAVLYDGSGGVVVEDIAEPTIEDPRDALVRVTTSAICGTDLHVLHGATPIAAGTPLGHEFVGEIVAIGPAVWTVSVGDRVFASDFTACGSCWWCARADHWHCPERSFFGYGSVFGKPLGGAQAEFVRVPHADVVLAKVPPRCSEEAAVFLGDTLATGFAAAERGQVGTGDIVAVIGAGTVGQMAGLACQTSGAAAVVMSDLVSDRRYVATELGNVAATPARLRGVLDELTDGRGADVAIDAVGGTHGLNAALECVRRRGIVVSIGAHFTPEFALPVDRAFAEEVTLTFAIGDAIRLRDRIGPILAAGLIDPTAVVSSRVRLADVPDAYHRFARHEELKVLIDMDTS